jgi:hypothetical protein
VLRLASLLWRLRRATAIDTGLLETSNTAPDVESAAANERAAAAIAQITRQENHRSLEDSDNKGQNDTLNSVIARRFLQLDCKAFERLGRYETALWRQTYQVIPVLDVLRRQNLDRNSDHHQARLFVLVDQERFCPGLNPGKPAVPITAGAVIARGCSSIHSAPPFTVPLRVAYIISLISRPTFR